MKTRCLVLSLAVACFASSARAEDVSGAAKAFSQAQEATLSGDVARAADLYELADELAPSAPALRNATRARLAAGHLAMAATNAAALLRRYPSDKESRETAEAVLSRLTPQLAQLDVACSAPCTLLLDGKAVAQAARAQHQLFSQPGAHTVAATFEGGGKASSQITAPAARITTVKLEAPAMVADDVAPPTREARPARASAGLSRWYAIGGGVLTLGLGGATIASGLATVSTRDKVRDATAAGNQAEAMRLYDTGRDQQLRTNILLGATIASGVGTAVLAIFTDWSGGEPKERELAVVPGGDRLTVVYAGRF